MNNVLYISDTADLVGGGERSLLTLLEHVDKQRFRLSLVVPAEGALSRAAAAHGVRVFIVPFRDIGNVLTVRVSARAVGDLVRIIGERSIDIVHTNSTGGIVLLAGLACHIARRPLVSHVRILNTGFGADALLRLFSYRVIAISEYTGRRFADLRRAGRLDVIYNGIDAERFLKPDAGREFRASNGIPDKSQVVGTMASYSRDKGIDIFIAAAGIIAKDHPEAFFVIAGLPDAQGRELRGRIESTGIQGRFIVTGRLPDPAGFFNAIDIFAFPTLRESFGRVAVEAMAAGKPVAAFATGGVPEVVSDGETGSLVARGNMRAFAQAVSSLLGDRAMAMRFGAAGISRAGKLFSAARYASDMERVYRGVYAQWLGYRRCPVCGAGDLRQGVRVRITRADADIPERTFRLARCRRCGVFVTHPAVVSESLYGEDYFSSKLMGFYGHCARCEQSNEPFAWRLSLLHRYCRGGRLLDIGCANGDFLAAAHRAGWECCGVEISEHACRLAEKHPGLRISRGTLAQAGFAGESFDAVSAGDVLEHVQDPAGFLEEVRRILKTGGYAYIAVPDSGSLHYRLMRLLCGFTGRNYFVLPHHLVHFTQRTLTLALQRQGFGIAEALHTESRRMESGIKRLFMETIALAGRLFSLRDRLVVVARKESLPASCSVAAVIVTYRNPGMLAGLLRSLEGQTHAPATVIIIDNSPDDETAEMVAASFPKAEYVHCPENIGSAGGFSSGIERASGRYEFIWLLDDDVELRPDSLERLLWGWFFLPGDRTRAGAVRSWCTYEAPFARPKRTESFAWRGTLIRSAAVRAIGLPERDYFLYGEDTEFSFRMRAAGFGIYWIPDSIVVEIKRPRGPRKFGRSKLYETPSRLYYAFRNQVHVFMAYRMYIKVLLTVAYACKTLLAAGLRSKDMVFAIIDGLRDGFLGRLGKNGKYSCREHEGPGS